MRILVVEDEPKVLLFLKQGLEELDYQVMVATEGLEGKKLIEGQQFDILLMDILLPNIDGNGLCKLSKSLYPMVPVIMLTALSDLQNKLEGFDAGADDYLIKPFEFKELVARIKVLTKRVEPYEKLQHVLKVADLELDLDQKIARRNDRNITLSAKEFALLEYLMRHQGRVISRPELAEKIWDITFDTGTNTVDVYINLLRKKIDREAASKLIHTRIGMGYILQQE